MSRHYIKAVMAYIQDGCAPHLTSLTSGIYQVVYTPGEWVGPTKEDSKLFVFPSLITAVEFVTKLESGLRLPDRLPFMGVMLWWCLAQGVTQPEQNLYKDLPDHLIDLFWNEYPYFPIEVPKAYQHPWGISMTVFADQVLLVTPVNGRELARVAK